MRSGRTLRTLNNTKIQNTNKCNIERIKASDKRFLFVCGDIELNPAPVNISSMSVLTTRLARIGRKPVNTIGDGNCFFRSVSHQLYGTGDRHPQIRALAIQHLINSPEHFVEYNTDQSWLVLCKLRVFHLRLRLRQKKLRLREKNSGSGRKHVKIEI